MSWTRRALCLLLLAATALHGAEVTVSVSEGPLSTPKINFAMTNNDAGAIYNSAELRLESIIGPVIDSILRHKPGYTTKSQVLGSISTHIWSPPTGEVYFGWDAAINPVSGIILITNNGLIPDVTYEVWRNTFYTGPYPILNDRMAVTLNLGGMLDFDGDSQLDDAERLLTLPPLTAAPDEASAGFVGIEGLTRYPAPPRTASRWLGSGCSGRRHSPH